MPHQSIRSDKAWLRQWLPAATSDQIFRFTERVGMKVDDANPPPDVLAKARDEALKELRFSHD
jgi:hypothetical protein